MSSCTDERNAQILIQVLKAHGIKKVIASPGTTNACLVSSMQSDPFFEIYSAPEERSGAYMACGMAAESGEPVVLSCTGATASRNYMPALTEAFYRKLPILTVTSSRRNAYIGHNCDQVTDRTVLPNDVAKISVQMPIVLDDVSEWNCTINANKAVLELYHRGGGPAHINLETTYSKKKVTDEKFLAECVTKRHWNVIVDFMAYSTQEFSKKVELFLESTNQYFFLSSSRVYAASNEPLTEDSPRLLDVCTDEMYLATDEYALAKARQENILLTTNKKNWTIIRPYKTYNNNRLQLGMYEKEEWLYRLMMGKTLVFPNELKKRKTTLTYAADVAVAISELIENESAYGEIFHITTTESLSWEDAFEKYTSILSETTGKQFHIKYVDDIEMFYNIWNPYQIKYDCNIDRRFDNSKINRATNNKLQYTLVAEGINKCLKKFIESPEWRNINWKLNFWMDNITGEKTKIWDADGLKEKARYVKYCIKK